MPTHRRRTTTKGSVVKIKSETEQKGATMWEHNIRIYTRAGRSSPQVVGEILVTQAKAAFAVKPL